MTRDPFKIYRVIVLDFPPVLFKATSFERARTDAIRSLPKLWWEELFGRACVRVERAPRYDRLSYLMRVGDGRVERFIWDWASRTSREERDSRGRQIFDRSISLELK